MICKKPLVKLINFTGEPKKAIALAVSAWCGDDFAESLEEITDSDSSVLTDKAFKAFHRTALEYVDTIWVIKNCSRAFQQQLTRTRLASFSIQSMRVVTKAGFATNGHYTMPPGMNNVQMKSFHDYMINCEKQYEGLIKSGIKTEDARGMLPLNIHSDITMRINLNALYHMLHQRLCVNTQWEYRQVALQMRQEINEKMGKTFSDPIDAPCVKTKKCPMGKEYCGIPFWKEDENKRVSLYNTVVSIDRINGKPIAKIM